jgi:hypothetical protein
VSSAITAADGFEASEEGQTLSLIHSIQFTGLSNDVWVLGSFALDPASNDFVYRGFNVATVPEPALLAPTLCLLLSARRRDRRPSRFMHKVRLPAKPGS